MNPITPPTRLSQRAHRIWGRVLILLALALSAFAIFDCVAAPQPWVEYDVQVTVTIVVPGDGVCEVPGTTTSIPRSRKATINLDVVERQCPKPAQASIGPAVAPCPGQVAACGWAQRAVLMKYPKSIPICDPRQAVEITSAATRAGIGPEDYPLNWPNPVDFSMSLISQADYDAEVELGLVDAGDVADASLSAPECVPLPTPDAGSTSPCASYVPDPSTLLEPTSCASCFATSCCTKFQAGINASDSTDQSETLAEWECWLDTDTMPACPPSPLAPNAGSFAGCMAQACAGACGGVPMHKHLDAGAQKAEPDRGEAEEERGVPGSIEPTDRQAP